MLVLYFSKGKINLLCSRNAMTNKYTTVCRALINTSHRSVKISLLHIKLTYESQLFANQRYILIPTYDELTLSYFLT